MTKRASPRLKRSEKLNLWALGFHLLALASTASFIETSSWPWGLGLALSFFTGTVFYYWSRAIERKEKR